MPGRSFGKDTLYQCGVKLRRCRGQRPTGRAAGQTALLVNGAARERHAIVAHRAQSGAAARGRCDHRQDLVCSAVGGVFLPANRAKRPFQHAADADRFGAEMKLDRALVQGALGLGGAAALITALWVASGITNLGAVN